MVSTSPLHRTRREPHTAHDHEASSHHDVEEASATDEGTHSGTATSTRERNEVSSDDDDEFGEEEGAEDAEGNSTQHPLSGVVAAVQTMAIVGRLMVLHDELDAGHANFYQQRRKLTVANDDWKDLNNNNIVYVRRVYVAITTTPAAMDDEQSKMAEVLAKKLETFGGDADQYLAGKS
jgi:hypothetical protein